VGRSWGATVENGGKREDGRRVLDGRHVGEEGVWYESGGMAHDKSVVAVTQKLRPWVVRVAPQRRTREKVKDRVMLTSGPCDKFKIFQITFKLDSTQKGCFQAQKFSNKI
jgi:hypothetical protein